MNHNPSSPSMFRSSSSDGDAASVKKGLHAALLREDKSQDKALAVQEADKKILGVLKEDLPAKTKRVKKPRCKACRKKIGLLPFECKCGLTFCMACRGPEFHACSYDWKADRVKVQGYVAPKIEKV